MTRTTIALATVGAAITVLAGCGGSSTATKTTTPAATESTTAPAANYGKQYLALIAPFNTALTQAKAAIDPTQSYTPDQLSALFARVAASMTTFDNSVLRATWPTNAQADIKAMTLVNSQAVSVLTNGNTASASTYTQNVSDALSQSAADSNIVRADLGLPPGT